MADLEQARQAKQELLSLLVDDRRVAGVGIAGSGHSYRLRLNVVNRDDCPVLPVDIAGVRIEIVEVGRIIPHNTQESGTNIQHA